MVNINRIILIVLDSVGVGELPDADKYNDVGANTLKHIFENKNKDFVLENMGKLGLYNIVPSPYGYKPKNVIGCFIFYSRRIVSTQLRNIYIINICGSNSNKWQKKSSRNSEIFVNNLHFSFIYLIHKFFL